MENTDCCFPVLLTGLQEVKLCPVTITLPQLPEQIHPELQIPALLHREGGDYKGTGQQNYSMLKQKQSYLLGIQPIKITSPEHCMDITGQFGQHQKFGLYFTCLDINYSVYPLLMQ